jgi:hypothetical protein
VGCKDIYVLLLCEKIFVDDISLDHLFMYQL